MGLVIASKQARAIRMFGKTRVTMVWDGKTYTATVKKPRRPAEIHRFSRLPERFGFRPDEDYAFDITARSALHSYGAR